jgi:hypothetical protein
MNQKELAGCLSKYRKKSHKIKRKQFRMISYIEKRNTEGKNGQKQNIESFSGSKYSWDV